MPSAQNPPSGRAVMHRVPNEVLHDILYYAALSRGVTRALRLKLVCRRFNALLDLALFKTELLDTFEDREKGRFVPGLDAVQKWPMGKPNGAIKFWQSYFAYRVRREEDPGSNPNSSFYAQLRHIAKVYCYNTGADKDETLDAICLLATEKRLVARWSSGNTHTFSHNSEALGVDLLAVATYLDCFSLAKDLLRYFCNPAEETMLFPSPLFLAGYTGNTRILRLFQIHPRNCGFIGSFESTNGALQLGNLDVLRVAAVRPYSITAMPSRRTPGTQPNQMEIRDNYLFSATSVETFIYSRNLMREAISPSKIGCLLEKHAGFGNVGLISHLLEQEGLSTDDRKLMSSQALVRAATRCQEEATDLLLERGGADPNNFRKSDGGSAIRAAARAGSLATVRKLLDHGICLLDERDEHEQNLCGKNRYWSRRHAGTCFEEYHMALVYAVRQEHTAMVELLLERKKPYQTASLKAIAEHEGLESMVKVLKGYDKRVFHDPRPRRGGWIGRGGEENFPNMILKDGQHLYPRSGPTLRELKNRGWKLNRRRRFNSPGNETLP